MSPIKSAPFYWCECDACGESQTHDGDISAWAQEDIAVQDVRDSDGLVQGYWRLDGQHDPNVIPMIVCGRCAQRYYDTYETTDESDGGEAEFELLDRDDPPAENRLRAWIVAQKAASA